MSLRTNDQEVLVSAASFEQSPKHPRRAPVRSAIGRSFGKWIAIGVTGLAVLILAVPLFGFVWNRLDLFGEKTIDRTGPVLLQALTDMHTYEAASGRFQVTVDIEKDAKWLPDAIRGERTVLNAEGTVTAGVDFAALTEGNIAIDPTTNAVTITLPKATLSSPHVDLTASRVVSRKRGMLDRLGSVVGDAPSDIDVYRVAESKLAKAARSSDLLTRAEANTTAMLTALAKGLGHTNVRVVFAVPTAAVNKL